MAPRDPYSNTPRNGAGSRLVVVIAIIIVLAIAAFLILRPNPSGQGQKNSRPSAPASN